MSLFLESALKAHSDDSEFLRSDATFLVRCYSVAPVELSSTLGTAESENRLLQVPAQVTYKDLQEAIDQKYGV